MEEQIIYFVKNNELLYNPKSGNYKNFELKLRKWKELAASLDMDVGKVRCRWKSLRDSFIRERNKLKVNSNSSNHKKWKYFDELSFLNTIPQSMRNRTIKKEKPDNSRSVFSNNSISLDEPDIYYGGETSNNSKHYEEEEEEEEDEEEEHVSSQGYVKTDFECIDDTNMALVATAKDAIQQFPPNHIELFFQSIAAQVENLGLSQQQFTNLEIRVLQLIQDYCEN